MEDLNTTAADTVTQAPKNVLLMPLYLCHKKVRAAGIIGIQTAPNNSKDLTLVIPGKSEQEENATLTVNVDEAWLTRNPKLEVGGYFVEYELMPGETEPYTAYSPAAALESGYSLVTDMGNAVPPATFNIGALEELVELHRQSGYWNFAPTDFGIANGLIHALAILKGEEPQYLTPPDVWMHQEPVESQPEDAQQESTRPAYQQRVIDECEQLDERLTKLKAFFATEIFAKMHADDQHMLRSQSDHMANYLQILRYRVSKF